jgi:CheY-like chemotaxis protein
MKMLVIGISPAANLSLIRALQRLGHTVLEAQTEEKAKDMVEQERPEFVFLDVTGLDGKSIVRHLRRPGSAGSAIPLVVCTANDSDPEAEKAFKAGADVLLTRPAELADEELGNVISRAREGWE